MTIEDNEDNVCPYCKKKIVIYYVSCPKKRCVAERIKKGR